LGLPLLTCGNALPILRKLRPGTKSKRPRRTGASAPPVSLRDEKTILIGEVGHQRPADTRGPPDALLGTRTEKASKGMSD